MKPIPWWQALRLFIGIDIRRDIAQRLALRQPERQPAVRNIAPEDMHLTLHFLGAGHRDAVAEALRLVRASAFSIVVRGMGQFRLRGGQIILWAGIADSEPLFALRQSVAGALAAVGFVPEARPFKPHVTLSRIGPKAADEIVEQALAGREQEIFGTFEAAQFLLYDTSPPGSMHRYERLRAYPLGGRIRA